MCIFHRYGLKTSTYLKPSEEFFSAWFLLWVWPITLLIYIKHFWELEKYVRAKNKLKK